MTNREMKQLLRQTNMPEDDAKKAIEILRQTNMTEYDIKWHIKNGVDIYENNQRGYEEYKSTFGMCIYKNGEFIETMDCEDDEIMERWEDLDIIGEYRVSFIL